MMRWQGVVLPLMGIIGWEAVTAASNVRSDAIAPPSAVAAAFWTLAMDGTLLWRTFETLSAACFGLLVGSGGGALAGLLLGVFPRFAGYLLTPIELIRPIPSIALIPLALMSFGFGLSMETAIVAFATFWPTLILAHKAISAVDPRLLEVAALLHLRTIDLVTKIVLPSALPRLLSALRLAIGLSLVVAVTIEIAANPQGLGYALIVAQQSLHPADMLALLLWVGVLGWGLNLALTKLEALSMRASI